MTEIPKKFYVEAKDVSEALEGTGAIPTLERYTGKEVIAEVYSPRTKQTYFLSGTLYNLAAPIGAFGITGTRDGVSDGLATIGFHVDNLRRLLVPCERVPSFVTRDNLEGKMEG